ncbi:energy-coupling factor ABC transporter ATP-binding protein [Candidatus Tisiphia endosymbiont of Temnostethus pusillus]|uniref:energy-coupling factor ABC transporter ATP-binding protein n=1 Tax=Candidatus Tisiphia endosymbiont of Temnostethus pusillus TaxID=3139335 RepID=UPI0035C9243C
MIKIENVSYSVNNYDILSNISLILGERKIGIVGANGSGKSTFARLLNGIKLPTTGLVTIDGLDTRKFGKEIRRKVGFVFQNPDNQIVFPIVEEDLAFGLKNLGYNKDKIEQSINSILSLYNIHNLRKSPSHLLSGGQKQLLAIAGVLVMKPDYIVFDEPTTLLDLRNKKNIFQVIEDLKQVVIMISHDLELLSNFDRVIVFDQGRIVGDDHPSITIPLYKNMMI